MYRFFAYEKINDSFILDNELINHLKVIRIKDKEFLINFENEFYLCKYEYPDKANIIKKLDINNEIDQDIIVAIPLIKQANFEIALQKCTELGVKRIYPFISEFCDKSNLKFENKKQRYQKIILEAAQQSFRNKIPYLEDPIDFDKLISLNIKNKILAYEKEFNNALNNKYEEVLLIVGPEGGFSKQEIEKAKENNVSIVALTKSILRAETAIIYMVSKIN
ncbi:16S rRNA (uracil(1498)-N(3))-methyltransferase [Mycoplasma struthionis]|uniref:Ribosomal RNA small subunit methyltransferase E n=1 Tax=Mycoplasma struthionis TaxID=538220 RepID=A0A3G8LHL6_9MOLU|nr:16S rRNA (uracil(1498)-N(3))-methyltransferase [Mycoplasma struthionis]AZG68854.1 16S rRNA (uracil(1498)-N(3))-methyltransferase [Mycoplasma struthionis]TPI01306.1 16S rRNA (uracil(1498)-N(3))-methyltransferase [Mycoplasma struthionis]